MVSHMLAEHGLDARRVFVTGLSAGGAMTAVMLATYPDVFAAGGVVAGLPYGVADNVQEALSAMYADSGRSGADLAELVRCAAPAGGSAPRLSIWHGDADSTVRPHNAVHLANQWAAVHGLTAQPSETQRLPGRTRTVWRSPTGEALVESNLVQGLAHGTPLDTAGPDGVGSAAPYMLEAGVSSSLEIARFWGLAPAADPAAEPVAGSKPRAQTNAHAESASGIGDQVMASVSGHVPAGVKSVIEQALKTAGLMK
jgi:poly(3-hydroxybutyrate) depolymerase